MWPLEPAPSRHSVNRIEGGLRRSSWPIGGRKRGASAARSGSASEDRRARGRARRTRPRRSPHARRAPDPRDGHPEPPRHLLPLRRPGPIPALESELRDRVRILGSGAGRHDAPGFLRGRGSRTGRPAHRRGLCDRTLLGGSGFPHQGRGHGLPLLHRRPCHHQRRGLPGRHGCRHQRVETDRGLPAQLPAGRREFLRRHRLLHRRRPAFLPEQGLRRSVRQHRQRSPGPPLRRRGPGPRDLPGHHVRRPLDRRTADARPRR